MAYWSIPPMWAGQTCIIMASGESMSEALAERIRAAAGRVIAVNTTFKLAPWADMLYAADAEWWKHYGKETESFYGLKVYAHDEIVPGVLQLKNTGKAGFDPDPSCVKTGGNSGYQAIHVAAHAGCNRILLCGFDMKGGHWHERHPYPLRDHGEGIYAKWIENCKTLAKPLAERGISVINCTPGSALKVWPIMELEEALASAVVIA